MTTDMAERLRWARAQQYDDLGRPLSQAGAALRLGLTPSAIAAHESGRNKLRPDIAQKYATAYHVSLEWLLYGRGGPEPTPRPVQIIGAVQAGWFSDAIEWPPIDHRASRILPNPHLNAERQFALEVRGDSMNHITPAGSEVLCMRLADFGREPPSSTMVVAVRHRGGEHEATLKILERHGGDWFLVPRSTNPMFQTAWRLPRLGLADQQMTFRQGGVPRQMVAEVPEGTDLPVEIYAVVLNWLVPTALTETETIT